MSANSSDGYSASWRQACYALVGLAGLSWISVAQSGEDISLADCPDAVRKTIAREAGDGVVKEVEIVGAEDAKLYEVDLLIDGTEYEALIDPSGRLLVKQLDDENEANDGDEEEGDDDDDANSASANEDEDEDEDDEGETHLRLDDLPKSVRKTLKRESRGGEIEEIERETEDGKVCYEAEVEYETADGELIYEIEINERGVLISKELSDEDDDEEDEGDE